MRFAALCLFAATTFAEVEIPADNPVPDGHVVVGARPGHLTVRRPRGQAVVGRDTSIPVGYVAVELIAEWDRGPGEALRIRKPRIEDWILRGTPIPEGYVVVEDRGRGDEARLHIRAPEEDDLVPIDSLLPGRFVAVERIPFHPPLAGPANRIREAGRSADVLAGTSIPKDYVIVSHEPGFRKGYVRIRKPSEDDVVCADSPIPENYVVTGFEGLGHYRIRIPRPREEVLVGSPVPPDYVVALGAPTSQEGRMIIRRARAVEPIVPGAPVPRGYVITRTGRRSTGSGFEARRPAERLWVIDESPLPDGWVAVARRTEGKQAYRQIRQPRRSEWVLPDSPIPVGFEAVAYVANHRAVGGPALEIRRVGRGR